MIRATTAELRRLAQQRGNRLVLTVCVGLVIAAVTVQAGRGQQVSFPHDFAGGLTGVGTALVFVTVAVGSNVVAKEFAAGALVMLITWEPRRARVVLAKSVAMAVGAAIAAFGVACTLALGLGAASVFGSEHQAVDASWMAARASQVGYLLVGVGAAGFIGATMTFVTRSTAFTISFFVLLSLLGERALDELATGTAEWAPAGLVMRLASGGAGFFQLGIASGTAAWRTFAWLGAFALLAVVVFLRREVR